MCIVWLTAPIALKSHGIGKGKNVTSHPGVADVMKEAGVYNDEVEHFNWKLQERML